MERSAFEILERLDERTLSIKEDIVEIKEDQRAFASKVDVELDKVDTRLKGHTSKLAGLSFRVKLMWGSIGFIAMSVGGALIKLLI